MNDSELTLALRSYEHRRPFRPFLLELFSGAQMLVNHPEAIDQFKHLWYYRGPGKAQALFSSSSVCRLLDLPAEA